MELIKNIELNSDRLILKGITQEDAPFLVKWRSREDICRVSGSRKPVTIDEHMIWFKKYINDPNEIRLIISAKDNKKIGMAGGKIEKGAFILSYYIGEEKYRGLGLMGEAVNTLISYVAGKGIQRFEAHVKEENISSSRMVLRLGFIKENNLNGFDIYIKHYNGDKT